MAIVRIRREERDGPEDELIEKVGAHNNPPAGLIVHAIGQVRPGEWQSVDIWESLEDAEKFEREVEPVLKEHLGADYQIPEPTTYEVYDIVRG